MSSKPTIFEFTSYAFEPAQKRIVFNYKTEFEDREPIYWTETIVLPKEIEAKELPAGLLNKTLESLHLILGISYWKYYCAPIVQHPYKLSEKEANFWNIVYKKGLGEFFYRNKLHPNISPIFSFEKDIVMYAHPLPNHNNYLVGIGGGKDSIVAAELLKQRNANITAFVAEAKQSTLIENVIEILGVGDTKIQRILDEKVHHKHDYNGHVPVSAIYAFLGILSCILYKHSNVVVGNEYSSNFGNTTYKGLEINHQWSKSFEFEALFQDYLHGVISPNLQYFSSLRAFHEIRIVKLFTKLGKKYFKYFSSCNRNFSIKGEQGRGLWCGECPKCVFAFLLLSAHISKKELLSIFGKNLYQQENLLPLFKDVLGFGTMKPFDCVGTFQEAQTALHMAKQAFKGDYIVRQLGRYAKHHSEVFETAKETTIPANLKFLGLENALILGYGREGRITKEYLKKYYPNLKVAIGDEAKNKNYLKKQSGYDIAIKTPGIKKELVTIPYTTATNIFFSHVKGNNTIIGVTGSKGKSTTASLIHHILKSAGKDVELLGNIGKPMLQAVLQPIPKERIFVLELSSYQLDDIQYSPDIAVATSLFPEHMDFHGNIKNYFTSKKRIIFHQNSHDFFVCNTEDKEIKQWLKNYKGNVIPFEKHTLKNNLLGNHNQQNIGAAVAVANILKIQKSEIEKAVESFQALPHRLELIGTFKGITFYNDANAATPEAAIMAIQALKNVDTIFLGGQDRGYNFTILEKVIKKYKIKNIVLFPDSGSKIIKDVKSFNILKTKNMKEAVAFAYKYTKQGSICLLSCASPSYSIWKNFEQKGEEFKKFVKKLA